MPNTGSRAVINTIIPIPPSQWVKERQKSMERGSTSTSVSIDEPVVVKPEQLSKKASVKLYIVPEITNGSAPTAEARNQLTDTIKNPSRFFILR